MLLRVRMCRVGRRRTLAFAVFCWLSPPCVQTWKQSGAPMKGYSPLGLSFVDPTHAFSALDNTVTQEAAIAVYD
jgi:hypothetical protein